MLNVFVSELAARAYVSLSNVYNDVKPCFVIQNGKRVKRFKVCYNPAK